MRPVIEEVQELVRKSEAYYPKPYICPAGWWTYGYGSVRDPSGKPVTATTPPLSSREEAEALMDRDLEFSAAAVTRLIPIPLNDYQFGALVDWVYNLGSGRLMGSTLRQVLLRKEYEDAPEQFERWVFGRDPRTGLMVKLPGLVTRRKLEIGFWERDL